MSTPVRRVWIGTSWKMNKTLAEARAFVNEVSACPVPVGVQPFFLPAHTALAASRAALPEGSAFIIGAQNAHWEPEGAGTGEVSMAMVADAGATMVEIGHSERRARFGETDETVGLKVAAALAQGLTPLVCVGESVDARDEGDTVGVIVRQTRAALRHVPPERVAEVMVAYEPVWAIGATGRPAEPPEVAGAIAALHSLTTEIAPARLRALLYGGGVSPTNAASLLSVPYVDGLFVGRAGWRAAGFLDLLAIAADHARTRAPGTPGQTEAESTPVTDMYITRPTVETIP